jgi:hypothetical protein
VLRFDCFARKMMWDFRYKAQGRVHKKLSDIFLRLFGADLGPPDASEGPNRGGVSLSPRQVSPSLCRVLQYLARSMRFCTFDTDSERAARWLIALMVLRRDPLAIALMAAVSRHGDQPTHCSCRADAIEGSQQLRAQAM